MATATRTFERGGCDPRPTKAFSFQSAQSDAPHFDRGHTMWTSAGRVQPAGTVVAFAWHTTVSNSLHHVAEAVFMNVRFLGGPLFVMTVWLCECYHAENTNTAEDLHLSTHPAAAPRLFRRHLHLIYLSDLESSSVHLQR